MSKLQVVVLSRRPVGQDDPVAQVLAPLDARVVACWMDDPKFDDLARDADAFVFSGGLTAEMLDKAPKCRIIARDGVGPLDDLLARSDFVSLHVPLGEGTHHLIGERELRLMQPSAILVNTARGAVVDEPALIRALQEGWIRGAGLDVFEKEPVDADNPLLKMSNVVVTPHIASASDVSNVERRREAAGEVLRVLSGGLPRPEAVVNKELFARNR